MREAFAADRSLTLTRVCIRIMWHRVNYELLFSEEKINEYL